MFISFLFIFYTLQINNVNLSLKFECPLVIRLISKSTDSCTHTDPHAFLTNCIQIVGLFCKILYN